MTKEIMRSLKRYVARQLFRTLATAHPILVPTDCESGSGWSRTGCRARIIDLSVTVHVLKAGIPR